MASFSLFGVWGLKDLVPHWLLATGCPQSFATWVSPSQHLASSQPAGKGVGLQDRICTLRSWNHRNDSPSPWRHSYGLKVSHRPTLTGRGLPRSVNTSKQTHLEGPSPSSLPATVSLWLEGLKRSGLCWQGVYTAKVFLNMIEDSFSSCAKWWRKEISLPFKNPQFEIIELL